MPTSARSCRSRCRLEEGTPNRRASSEAYHPFSGCTSVAARIPWRVLGSSASRVCLLRILRNYRRDLRKHQGEQYIQVESGFPNRSSLHTGLEKSRDEGTWFTATSLTFIARFPFHG